jgi:orotidine-5'-phosphate decarboxylase
MAGMFKVGGQLFMCGGPDVVLEIIRNRGKVFLDLKFHDIPNTVTHAVVEAAKLGVSMMTIHASGGRAMMQAVSKELHEQFGPKRPMVVAVTVLTSFDTRALFEIGLERPLEEQVQRLALFTQECGIDGVVCSPREIQLVRNSVNPNFKIVTPGIRISRSSHPESACRTSPWTTSNVSQRLTMLSLREPITSSWAGPLQTIAIPARHSSGWSHRSRLLNYWLRPVGLALVRASAYRPRASRAPLMLDGNIAILSPRNEPTQSSLPTGTATVPDPNEGLSG